MNLENFTMKITAGSVVGAILLYALFGGSTVVFLLSLCLFLAAMHLSIRFYMTSKKEERKYNYLLKTRKFMYSDGVGRREISIMADSYEEALKIAEENCPQGQELMTEYVASYQDDETWVDYRYWAVIGGQAEKPKDAEEEYNFERYI